MQPLRKGRYLARLAETSDDLRAAQRLRKAGYAKVYWLEGGLGAWQQAQMPLVAGRA